MTDLAAVLAEVEGRVGYLRALTAVPADEPGWVRCDGLTPAVVESALVGSKAGDDAVVAASLFAQSYAFRVAGVSLAAWAVGLPWPSPAGSNTAVRLGSGRASQLAVLDGGLGDPADRMVLAAALRAHLEPVLGVVEGAVRLGPRLLEGNVAASVAAAFRAVEGAARGRHDLAEAAGIRARGEAFLADWGGGRFGTGPEWPWERGSCCLWFRSSGRTCEDCSLPRRGG